MAPKWMQTAGSLFFSRNFSRDYEERLFRLGQAKGDSSRLLPHSAIPLCLSRLLNARPSDPQRKKRAASRLKWILTTEQLSSRDTRLFTALYFLVFLFHRSSRGQNRERTGRQCNFVSLPLLTFPPPPSHMHSCVFCTYFARLFYPVV